MSYIKAWEDLKNEIEAESSNRKDAARDRPESRYAKGYRHALLFVLHMIELNEEDHKITTKNNECK